MDATLQVVKGLKTCARTSLYLSKLAVHGVGQSRLDPLAVGGQEPLLDLLQEQEGPLPLKLLCRKKAEIYLC